MDIKITKTTNPFQKPNPQETLPFGKIFTDHMFLMEFTPEKGWFNPRIEPYSPLTIAPSTSALHYGQLIFEGLKAYKNSDGQVSLFRPYENAHRLNKSATRLCMPNIDPNFTVMAISKLLEIDKDWVPHMPGTAMYIRPFMMATDESINLPPSENYLFMIILSPVGHLFKEGPVPLKIYVENEYVRAANGGTGFAKCAGNYAGAAIAGVKARDKGFNQVLWLDAVHRKYIEEVSAMNVFFVIDGKVITPQSPDSILGGITRSSVMTVINEWGIPLEERPIAIDELANAYKNNKVSEVFCTGTAAVVSPIGEICWGEERMLFNTSTQGLTQKLYNEITGIQTSTLPDKHGWVVSI